MKIDVGVENNQFQIYLKFPYIQVAVHTSFKSPSYNIISVPSTSL